MSESKFKQGDIVFLNPDKRGDIKAIEDMVVYGIEYNHWCFQKEHKPLKVEHEEYENCYKFEGAGDIQHLVAHESWLLTVDEYKQKYIRPDLPPVGSLCWYSGHSKRLVTTQGIPIRVIVVGHGPNGRVHIKRESSTIQTLTSVTTKFLEVIG